MLLIPNCETGTIFYFSRAFRNFTKIISRHGSVFNHFFLSLNDVKLNTEDLVVCIFRVSAWGYILLHSILFLDSSYKKSLFPGTILIHFILSYFFNLWNFPLLSEECLELVWVWLFTMSSRCVWNLFFPLRNPFVFRFLPLRGILALFTSVITSESQWSHLFPFSFRSPLYNFTDIFFFFFFL